MIAWEISEMVLLLAQSLLSPFFGSGIKTDFFQSFGQVLVFHIRWQMMVSILAAASPAALNNSIGMLSKPGDFLFVKSLSAFLISDSSGSGSFPHQTVLLHLDLFHAVLVCILSISSP